MRRKNKALISCIFFMIGILSLGIVDICPALAAEEDESILGVTIRGEWGNPNTHSLAVDAGVRWVRTSVSWAAHEPVQGQRNLSGLDSFFKSFTDLGLKPIVFIAENPTWAASSGCGPIDKVSLQALADFMGALAERYDGDGDYDGDGVVDGPALPRIDYWALYNEPDNRWTTGEASTFAGCWGRNGQSFAQLLGLVKQAVQRANPNAKVILGIAGEKVSCPSTWSCAGQDIFNFNIAGGDFVDDVLGYIQSHPGDYFDIFDFHYYPAFQWQWASWGNGILGKARYYQNRLQSHGLSKPMIVTETGKKSDGTGGDEAQTNHLIMTYIRAMAAGLKSVMWFTFTDIYDGGTWAGWGLLDRNYAPKPSYSVYKVLSEELEGAAFSQILPLSTGQEGYAFVLPGGENLWVAWGSGNITIQSNLAQVIDKWGAARAVTNNQGNVVVALSGNPVYIRFGGSAQYVITATAGTGGSISPTGNVNVPAGSNQTFSVTPSSGYRILDVKVDGVSQGAVSSYTFSNVTANHSIGATFAQVGQGGSGSQVVFAVNCGGGQYTDKSGIIYQPDMKFSGGQVYTTTAAIAGTEDGPLYQSERWGNFSYNIPVPNGNYNVNLKFAELYCWGPNCRVFSLKVEGREVISNLDLLAKVSKNRAYDFTTPVTVSDGMLTIEFYSTVNNAKVNAILVTSGQPVSQFTITATAGAGGTISPSGVVNVTAGSNQTFTITPNSGYRIADVKVDGVTAGAITSKTFANVTSKHTIEASFTATTTYLLSIAKNGTGTGNVTSNPGGSSFNPGTVVTLTATPDGSSTFAGWSGGCTGTSVPCQVTMSGNGSVTATFNLKPTTYTITTAASANGAILPQGPVTVNSGSNQTFSITPNQGYAVGNVKVDGVSQGAIPSYTFNNVTVNHTMEATFAPVGSQPQVVFAVNCGGTQYTDKSGVVYKADMNSGGQVYTTTAPIAGTDDGPLYQSERYGNFSYNIPVPNGSYLVTLKFAEIYPYAHSGSRIFDVTIEGKKVISNLDLVAKVGKNRAYDFTTPVTVTDGARNIDFYAAMRDAKVNAILVTSGQ